MAGDQPLFSPLHDYHSAIALAAYKAEYTVDDTLRLYSDDVFCSLGFYDIWDVDRNEVIRLYNDQGIDLRHVFTGWSRLQKSFMHVFNHPKIDVIFDIAIEILRMLDVKVDPCDILPHDNLAIASVYPVYPGLSERFGFAGGSYRFKPHGSYNTISLREFIVGCHQIYDRVERSALTSDSPQFHAAYQMLTEAR